MNHDEPEATEGRGHEAVDTKMSPIVLSLVALLGTVVLSLIVVALALSFFSHTRENVPRVMAQPEKPPAVGPVLDASQADDQKQLRLHQERLLSEYQWLDHKAGIARIPITRAMEITSQKLARSGTQPHPSGGGDE